MPPGLIVEAIVRFESFGIGVKVTTSLLSEPVSARRSGKQFALVALLKLRFADTVLPVLSNVPR
jgi:hypothetical protein